MREYSVILARPVLQLETPSLQHAYTHPFTCWCIWFRLWFPLRCAIRSIRRWKLSASWSWSMRRLWWDEKQRGQWCTIQQFSCMNGYHQRPQNRLHKLVSPMGRGLSRATLDLMRQCDFYRQVQVQNHCQLDIEAIRFCLLIAHLTCGTAMQTFKSFVSLNESERWQELADLHMSVSCRTGVTFVHYALIREARVNFRVLILQIKTTPTCILWEAGDRPF